MSAGQSTDTPRKHLATRDPEEAATWEPIRPPEGYYGYHHGCCHGRKPRTRR